MPKIQKSRRRIRIKPAGFTIDVNAVALRTECRIYHIEPQEEDK